MVGRTSVPSPRKYATLAPPAAPTQVFATRPAESYAVVVVVLVEVTINHSGAGAGHGPQPPSTDARSLPSVVPSPVISPPGPPQFESMLARSTPSTTLSPFKSGGQAAWALWPISAK